MKYYTVIVVLNASLSWFTFTVSFLIFCFIPLGLGFYHTQSSPDRDDYITIEWDNIMPDKTENFLKYPESWVTDFNISYDYDSIMHYRGITLLLFLNIY